MCYVSWFCSPVTPIFIFVAGERQICRDLTYRYRLKSSHLILSLGAIRLLFIELAELCILHNFVFYVSETYASNFYTCGMFMYFKAIIKCAVLPEFVNWYLVNCSVKRFVPLQGCVTFLIILWNATTYCFYWSWTLMGYSVLWLQLPNRCGLWILTVLCFVVVFGIIFPAFGFFICCWSVKSLHANNMVYWLWVSWTVREWVCVYR